MLYLEGTKWAKRQKGVIGFQINESFLRSNLIFIKKYNLDIKTRKINKFPTKHQGIC